MPDRSELLVTIGIPTYNRADRYMRDALRSALAQTYSNLEIIVSDNCSKDGTTELVNSFNDPRIRYFRHEKNIGANNNFNFALNQAKGKYFLLLQDDDLIDADFIETCMRSVDPTTEVGIIRTGTRIIDHTGRILNETPNMVEGLSTEDFFRGWFSGKTTLYLCSTLFNTKLLKGIGGFGSKHNLFQDVMAEAELAARFGRIDVCDVKASFRKHDSEMTFSAAVGSWCEDSLILLEQMCEILPEEKRQQIRKEGMCFFSRINYGRAAAVKSLSGQYRAYGTVWKYFGFRHFPPVKSLIFAASNLLQGTRLHFALRSLKRGISSTAGKFVNW